MAKIVNRKIILDGLAAIIDLGFVPDICDMEIDDGTNVDHTRYFNQLEDDNDIFGYLTNGSDGVRTRLTTAATGLSAFDTSVDGVVLPAPDGNGEENSLVTDYSTTTTYTARSATVLGSAVRPTTRNGLVMELTTASGGAAGTEPTWPTVAGNSVTANSGDVWIARDEKTIKIGRKGITIGASVANNTDGLIAQIVATKLDSDPAEVDAGSVAASVPV